MDKDKKRLETLLCHDEPMAEGHFGAVVPPIYQNTLFAFDSWEGIDSAFDNMTENFVYSRLMNPTVEVAEKKIAAICGGEKAKLCASGMGAISAAIMHCIKKESHIITIKSVYGPANNFINVFLREKCGVEVTYVSGTRIEEFEQALRPNTSLIYLESPASMTFELQDLRAVAQLAKNRGIKTVIDNTWATPIFQKPIEMGIDLEVHSVSKYLCGHSDVVAGVVVGTKEDIDRIIVSEHALLGAKMAPFEGWLILRSLRTLPMRMKQHHESADKVALFLDQHPRIRSVLYPGLTSFSQYELACKQMTGCGGLFSIELDTDNLTEVKRFVNTLRMFKIGVSWGGFESLIYSPSISYAKELPLEQFSAMGIKPGMVRLSIGLEHRDDLINDLKMALLELKGK